MFTKKLVLSDNVLRVLPMKHGKSKVNSQNTLKTVKKKQSDLIRTRGKQIHFAPATWADHLSNFFVFNLFCMRQSFFKTKIAFNRNYFRLFITPKSSF
jgi:hypothetical protein